MSKKKTTWECAFIIMLFCQSCTCTRCHHCLNVCMNGWMVAFFHLHLTNFSLNDLRQIRLKWIYAASLFMTSFTSPDQYLFYPFIIYANKCEILRMPHHGCISMRKDIFKMLLKLYLLIVIICRLEKCAHKDRHFHLRQMPFTEGGCS